MVTADPKKEMDEWPLSSLRADARRNLHRIIAAAVELLSEEGVGVSMNAIAARAGVGIGTLYRNFPNKAELLEVVNRHTLEAIYAETEAVARSAPPESAFIDAAHHLVRALASRAELFDATRLARGSISVGRSQLESFCQLFEDLVTQAQELAAIRVDVAGDEILSLVGAACLASAAGDADEADRLFSLMTTGLVPSP